MSWLLGAVSFVLLTAAVLLDGGGYYNYGCDGPCGGGGGGAF